MRMYYCILSLNQTTLKEMRVERDREGERGIWESVNLMYVCGKAEKISVKRIYTLVI